MQLRGVRRAAAWCATCSCVMLVVQIMAEKIFLGHVLLSNSKGSCGSELGDREGVLRNSIVPFADR